MIVVLAFALVALAPAGAYAQTTPRTVTPNTVELPPGAPRPPARIGDLAWLAGRWEGDGLGGRIEEVWSAPAGGAMIGCFRLIHDGEPIFYEIMTLLEHEGSVEMRLKHVNADMTGWEERNDFVTFRLVRQDASGAPPAGLSGGSASSR